jgi:hypothetical protein
MKLCPKCSVEKPETGFYTRPRGDLQSWCKDCMKALRVQRNPQIAAYQRKRRSGRTEGEKLVAKNYQLRYHFGITLRDYKALLISQNHRCAICDKLSGTDIHDGKRRKQLSVDHDHETGAIRGLLCNGCNRALGQLGDSLEHARRLVAYLERFDKLLQEVYKARV